MVIKTTKPIRYTISFFCSALLFSAIIFGMVFFLSRSLYKKTNNIVDYDKNYDPSYPTIIIDPGHGGEDGGAVGINGVFEKDLNLSLSLDLAAMLRSSGYRVILTRETDTMLYDKNVDYKGRKKQLDLSERVRIAENCDNAIFISIHMNSFLDSRYSGLQVYYSGNSDGSRSLAEAIQNSVTSELQKDNERVIKQASDNIYLLKNIKKPAVLIECGFISNSVECERLCDENYRKELSLAVFCGINSYISEYCS